MAAGTISLVAILRDASLRDAPQDEVEGRGRVGFWSADDLARYSYPRTGGESQVRFVAAAGLGGTAETL